MKITISCLVVLAFIFGISGLTMAGDKAAQVLMVNVQVINKVSVRGAPGVVGVGTSALGQRSKVTKDDSLSYSITVSGTDNVTITGKINSPMPDGTALYIKPATLKGATNQSNVNLSTTEQDLLTEITKRIKDDTPVTYSFTYSFVAAEGAGEVRQQTRPVMVTLTVTY